MSRRTSIHASPALALTVATALALCCVADASAGVVTERAVQPRVMGTAEREAIAQLMGQLGQAARGLRDGLASFHAPQWKSTLDLAANLGSAATLPVAPAAPRPLVLGWPGNDVGSGLEASVHAHLVDLPPPVAALTRS